MTNGDPTFEQRVCRALFDAMIPNPGAELPGMREVALESFWERWHMSAPLHLRGALRLAAWIIGVAFPIGLGYGGPIVGLTPAQRDELLQRASTTPLLQELVEVLKIAACFAYFDDPHVQNTIRDPTARTP